MLEADDQIEIFPPELHDLTMKVITGAFTKRLAAQYNKPWTEQQEEDLQENIKDFRLEAKKQGIAVIKMKTTKTTETVGSYEIRMMPVEKIGT